MLETAHTFVKSPREDFDYIADFTAWLDEGDTILTSSVEVLDNSVDPDTPLVIHSASNTTKRVIFYAADGTNNEKYKIRITINTENLLVKETILYISVKEN